MAADRSSKAAPDFHHTIFTDMFNNLHLIISLLYTMCENLALKLTINSMIGLTTMSFVTIERDILPSSAGGGGVFKI